MTILTNIPKKIFNFFTHTAEQIAKETQFKIRASKITPKAFVHGLLRSCFLEGFTLERFCSELSKQNIVVRKQSLFERCNERTANFLKKLSMAALNEFKIAHLPQTGLLAAFSVVNIIDSTTISLNPALNKLYKGSGGAASSAAIKIQTLFDSLNLQVKQLALTSGCANDQSFNDFLNSIEKGALYLMDLGYFKFTSFQKIINGGAFFVSRLLKGTALFTPDGQVFDLMQELKKAPNQFSKNLLMGVKARIPVRVVAHRVPKVLAEQRQRKLKKTIDVAVLPPVTTYFFSSTGLFILPMPANLK